MMTPVLTVENLSIAFEKKNKKDLALSKVVQEVSFTIDPGQTVAVVGESGSGKTVMALSLLQLLPPETCIQGQAIFQNTSLRQSLLDSSSSDIRQIRGKRIAVIFQEPMISLNPLHTVEKQLKESLELCHKNPSSEHVITLLKLVQLKDPVQKSRSYPHQLSGGERQRVMIAMALAGQPDILIADEPTTALDVTTQAEILKLLQDIQQRFNMALLLITHDLKIVRQLADKILVMEKGHLVETGSRDDIFLRPHHPYTQKLVSSALPDRPAALLKNAPILAELKNVAVRFPIRSGFLRRIKGYTSAVHPLNLEIKQGETLGIVGESGSGKTSLALALLSLIPAEGEILFQGQSLTGMKPKELRARRQDLQIVFQDPFASLNPRRTVEQSVGEGLEVHYSHLSLQERQTRILQVLQEVGLESTMKDRYPHAFSGGQRQRIAIARAMILKPKILVLDEPTSALDQAIQLDILNLLKALQQSHHTSYIFISHDLRVVRALSHRILVMKDGEVVEQGEADRVFKHPQHPYTQRLLASVIEA